VNQLEMVAKSYDKGIIEHGNKDFPSYDNLPDYITDDPDYIKYKMELESGGANNGSEAVEIKDYLLPERGMNFVDLGCSLNLMFKGYDEWASTYYGVDISKKTIELLNAFVAKKNLSIGSLYCGSVHDMPFDDNAFDIGACIGVLEYFEKDFVETAIREAHRVIKPNGKFVLDIPNISSSTGRMMMRIEEYLGRCEMFDLLPHEFEVVLQKYFKIEKSSRVGIESEDMGFGYYLRCKK